MATKIAKKNGEDKRKGKGNIGRKRTGWEMKLRRKEVKA
jgi:hypothetical protein